MASRPALNSLRRVTHLVPCRASSSATPSLSLFLASSRTSTSGTTTSTRTLTPSSLAARPFSTTAPVQTKTIKPHRLPSNLIPPYPYGERRIYKQSNKGLYGSARIRFGNIVAEKHKNKTRRYWRPNVHVKAFYSPALGARVKTRLTLRVLKTIRREGGIDNYLLKSKPARIKELGPGGWNLRWLLMQTRAVQERFNEERVALGLEPREIEDRDDVIQYALDFATPGPLSVRSRATLGEMNAAMADAFVLGDDALADLEGVEELSDEAEELLLRELEEADRASDVKAKTEKQGVDA
ncbi:50S ribosomal protein L24 [Purpureocillium lavendulum]|uniref:Large ribosomal subunit protein bL28m n=1 Tax=Purpureocillium lavendulum TaxID=1247861 RepID=A0AB34FRG2_9HYPO|nr:50S ribosomal protein L24 [Purpureocillium lavendulum]